MHCVFSYDLTAFGDRRKEIEDEIDKILKPYRWAKRLTTFYIVEVNSKEGWEKVLEQMKSLSRDIPEKFHFVMSPPLAGGRYDGILPKGKWDFVNEITSNS